ncbi:MAG: phospholipid carrier-dependent glycosyltransferase [Candidatus Omnitrophota bacterium]|nr:phospholipid carrier-dependent glycosyltransferase [Candidatus Omnitrophota bacterium]
MIIIAANKKFYNLVLFGGALCAILVVSSFILFTNVEKTQLHRDEPGHIVSAYYYTDLVLQLDFDVNKWEGKHLGGFGSRLYLHLGQVLMGVPLEWYAMRHGYKFENMYDYGVSVKENKRAGKIPPQGLLMFARRTVAFFGILCCALILAIGYYSRNIWVGGLAAVFLIKNKLFIMCATRAMTDMHYNFFLLGACLLVVIFARSPRKQSFFSLSFYIGIVAGLAASVKLIGIAVIGLFFLLYLIYQYFLKNAGWRNILVYMAIFSVSAIVVIYLLNPYLWDIRHPLKFPTLVKTWYIINDEQAQTAIALWNNNRLLTLHRILLFKFQNFSFDWVLLGAGIFSSVVMLVRSVRTHRFDARVVPFLFFMANYVFILVFLTVSWSRYYLPTIIAGKLVIAAGVYEIGISFYRYFFINKTKSH